MAVHSCITVFMNSTKTANAKRLHCPIVAEVMTDLAVEYMPGVRILEFVPAPVVTVAVPK